MADLPIATQIDELRTIRLGFEAWIRDHLSGRHRPRRPEGEYLTNKRQRDALEAAEKSLLRIKDWEERRDGARNTA